MAKIRKAIIPVAGFGTRFLPATKAQPKGMLTVVDKPIIQYVVEEAIAAGIEQVIFVTDHNKRAIEDHFDRNFELEWRLQDKGKMSELKEVTHISELASFVYVRQPNPNGDGAAILLARQLVGDEPVAVLFSDEVYDAAVPPIGQLIRAYERYHDPIIAVRRTPLKDISRYGVAGGREAGPRTWEVTDLVEKPKPEDAPSDLAIMGRYIITPEVFEALGKATPSKGGEIRLIDAFRALRGKRSLYAYEVESKYYDCGDKLQFLTAIVDYGLKHPEVNKGGAFAEFLKRRALELGLCDARTSAKSDRPAKRARS